jgi:hypothetical protein
MDPHQLLIDMLSRKVSSKVSANIQVLVDSNLCVCCKERPIFRDGNCGPCDYEITEKLKVMPETKRLKYLQNLYARGLRLRPYEIRKYRRKATALEKQMAS